MVIDEYKIILDDKFRPMLSKVGQIEWGEPDSEKFIDEEDMVVMFNEMTHLNEMAEEYFYVIAFDYFDRPIGVYQVSHGTWNFVYVGIRELNIFLCLVGAHSYYVIHNHCLNMKGISEEDLDLTKSLKEYSDIVGIDYCDHLIVLKDSYISIDDNEEVRYPIEDYPKIIERKAKEKERKE